MRGLVRIKGRPDIHFDRIPRRGGISHDAAIGVCEGDLGIGDHIEKFSSDYSSIRGR